VAKTSEKTLKMKIGLKGLFGEGRKSRALKDRAGLQNAERRKEAMVLTLPCRGRHLNLLSMMTAPFLFPPICGLPTSPHRPDTGTYFLHSNHPGGCEVGTHCAFSLYFPNG
jgi:hypothetical protein